MCQRVRGGYAVSRRKGGAPSNPDWCRNLLARRGAAVEVGAATVEAVARAPDDEHQPISERRNEDYPGQADYERQSSRPMPVVILEPS